MIKNLRNTYENITVQLENSEFIECRFINCTLMYSGLGPVSMQGCSFNKVNWVFTGPAQNTLQFMRAIYQGAGEGGKQLIEKTFENIRKP
ncbi:MAG: pentapeptide repeat-containing protein [Desulfobacterales bacterium]|nr:pentapeptide repeat-containing protein [Pseudomonadota bacterium]MBU4356582.1 pentapeptide repeat-containing protein [Pseudomonadota bacterium]MCG2772247.1 pentapeptide repeat-containing protein [Desulfobacterales bacterium]